jgi:hypothetical protein
MMTEKKPNGVGEQKKLNKQTNTPPTHLLRKYHSSTCYDTLKKFYNIVVASFYRSGAW